MKICKNIFGHRLECLGNFLDFYIVFSFLDKCSFPGASKGVFSEALNNLIGFRIPIYRYNFSYFYKDLDTTVCPAIKVLNKESHETTLCTNRRASHKWGGGGAGPPKPNERGAASSSLSSSSQGRKKEEEEGNGRVVGFAVNQRGLMTIYRWAFPLEHAGSDWIRARLVCVSPESTSLRDQRLV